MAFPIGQISLPIYSIVPPSTRIATEDCRISERKIATDGGPDTPSRSTWLPSLPCENLFDFWISITLLDGCAGCGESSGSWRIGCATQRQRGNHVPDFAEDSASHRVAECAGAAETMCRAGHATAR